MTPFDGAASLGTVTPTRQPDQAEAREAQAAVSKLVARAVSGADAQQEVCAAVMMRALEKFPNAPTNTGFAAWATGCAPNVIREWKKAMATASVASDQLDGVERQATFSGRQRQASAPAGFGRLPSGQLARGYDEIDGVIYTGGPPDRMRPLQSEDIEAIEGVFHLAASMITGIGDGLSMHVVDAASASWLDKVHAAYSAAYGYPAKEARWVNFTSALTLALERVLLGVHDGDRELAPEDVRAELRERLGRLPEWVSVWLTDSVLRSLLDRATLARGGRGKKNSQVLTTAVSKTVNTARKGLGLAPLSDEALNLFRPTKRAKRKTKTRSKR